jgi:uncharacterized protein YacL
MRWLTFYRFGFVVLFILLGRSLGVRIGFGPLESTLMSLGIGLSLLVLEYFVATRRAKDVLAFLFGFTMALIISNLFAYIITQIPLLRGARFWIYLLSNLVGIYIFGSFAYHKREELRFLNFFFKAPHRYLLSPKILDTSVIIDGRILGIAKSGFLDGEIIVPRFILRELQRIADSKDHSKRTRGRRGLDVLKEMQEIAGLNLVISYDDFPSVKEVDQKLIELAKRKRAKIVTIDYNLKKMADLQGVKVLNINELSKELKPILMPGDIIQVKVIKQGKEETQGVGYLEDGTMVVIENGSIYMGQEVLSVVETVLQTEAGRMVFAKPFKEEKLEGD